MEKLIVSSSPHLHGKTTTTSIMRDVLIALTPAAIAAVVLFGIKALIIISVCVATCVFSEFIFNLIAKKKQTVGDLSAMVTGLLLALSLSTRVSIWHCVVGSVFAIVVVKCLFGGIGCNFANPAVTARVLLLIAFGKVAGGAATNFMSAELVASATPLAVIKDGEGELPTLIDMLIGNRGGAIGEACAIALILGFIYLVIRRVITWETPVVFVATVFVLSLIVKQDLNAALYQVLGGGLLLGAIFMATDYVTTPITRSGRALFALGCGVITVLIRFWGDYPEGVSFAILFMNILTPYIERLCRNKPIGGVKNEK
ncbi:MAG: RnfABCDGE type electron transport complex subunit D [Ruminococcaceae bacterium]|nr:RnfABCDGE type electron transport complex subunit D [Oscillospiraceae bacterium]